MGQKVLTESGPWALTAFLRPPKVPRHAGFPRLRAAGFGRSIAAVFRSRTPSQGVPRRLFQAGLREDLLTHEPLSVRTF